MKKLLIYLLIIVSPAAPAVALAEEGLVIIANTGGEEISLTREQVRNLFMGASLGYDFEPVALPPRNHTRSIFNTQVIGLTESRIQSYWSQMKFTGRMKPPKELDSEQDILEFVVNNEGSVAYVPARAVLPEGLTVVFTTD